VSVSEALEVVFHYIVTANCAASTGRVSLSQNDRDKLREAFDVLKDRLATTQPRKEDNK